MSNIIIKWFFVDVRKNLILFVCYSNIRDAVAHFFSSFFEQIIYYITQIHINRIANLYALAMQVRYFFALNCRIYLIRGPPVLFDRSKSKEQNK